MASSDTRLRTPRSGPPSGSSRENTSPVSNTRASLSRWPRLCRGCSLTARPHLDSRKSLGNRRRVSDRRIPKRCREDDEEQRETEVCRDTAATDDDEQEEDHGRGDEDEVQDEQ